MPTYQYLCNSCGHEFEQFQSIKANPLRKCPACSRMELNRLIGAGGGIIFKGSGFYQTDYRSENYKTGANSAKPAAETKDTTKKETTPAKTEPKSKSKDTPKSDNN
ncbi:MAG: zinc ribbon domain-containing protein [Phycisphaerae bacterium]|nr:zinc ribbon domain-containing protein [Phycisphaerae bacterium]